MQSFIPDLFLSSIMIKLNRNIYGKHYSIFKIQKRSEQKKIS